MTESSASERKAMKNPMTRTERRARAGAFLRLARAAAGNRDGMAATEFALILPIMTTVFFGMLEVSDAMMANRRVVNAANALADLVTQEKKITTGEVDDVFEGVTRILQPTDDSTVSMRLLSVTLDEGDPDNENDDRIVVEWSRDADGDAPYAAGAEYDKLEDVTIIKSGVSLVVAELTYEHRSGLTNKILGSPITFDRMASRWPRRSTRVQLCNADYSSCS